MSDAQRDTYKYHLKEGGKVLARGVTNSLERREAEIRERFPNAHIKQVGRRTTRKAALKWEDGGGKRKYNKVPRLVETHYSAEELEGEAMSDIGRCNNPECNHKWDREANQTCPKCGTVYVPPEPYDTAVTPEFTTEVEGVSVETLLDKCVAELRHRGRSWKWIRDRARGVASRADSG